jgi:hypothetical protein
MATKARSCWTTRDEFMKAVDVVNADVKLSRHTTVRFETQYTPVADRIASLAKSIGAQVLRTMYLTDGWRCHHVITVKGFYQARGAQGGR